MCSYSLSLWFSTTKHIKAAENEKRCVIDSVFYLFCFQTLFFLFILLLGVLLLLLLWLLQWNVFKYKSRVILFFHLNPEVVIVAAAVSELFIEKNAHICIHIICPKRMQLRRRIRTRMSSSGASPPCHNINRAIITTTSVTMIVTNTERTN